MSSNRRYRIVSPVDMRGCRPNQDSTSNIEARNIEARRADLQEQLHRLISFISTDNPGLSEENLIKLKQQMDNTEEFMVRGLGFWQRIRKKTTMKDGHSDRERKDVLNRKRRVEENKEASDGGKKPKHLPKKRQRIGRDDISVEKEGLPVNPAISQAFGDAQRATLRASTTAPNSTSTTGRNINTPSPAMHISTSIAADRRTVDSTFTLIFRAREVPSVPLSARDQAQYIRIPTIHLYKYAPFLSGIFSANRSTQWHEENNHDDQYVYDPNNTALTKSYIHSKVVYISPVIESETLMPLGEGRYDAAKLTEPQRWATLLRLVKWIASGDKGGPRVFEPLLSNREKRNILLLAETLQCDCKEFLDSVNASVA